MMHNECPKHNFAKEVIKPYNALFSLVDNHCVVPVHEDTSALTCHWPSRMISFARGYFNSVSFVLFLPSPNFSLAA